MQMEIQFGGMQQAFPATVIMDVESLPRRLPSAMLYQPRFVQAVPLPRQVLLPRVRRMNIL